MKYPWLDQYLLDKRGVTKDLQPDWNWIRYHVGGKMFAAVCLDEQDRPVYITLKLEPAEGDFLRQQYEDIIPGYYCNKLHWNSVRPDGQVPDALLREMLDKSYQLVLGGFSRKRQREILGLSCCGAECSACGCFGSRCKGCSALCGKVFHAPKGEACPIYACAARKGFATCAPCGQLPCSVWRTVRDPQLSDAEFAQSIAARIGHLKQEVSHGV